MRALALLLAVSIGLTACTTTLVNAPVKRQRPEQAQCSGSEWTDNSSMAVLPIPLVAFFVPHVDIHDIRADDYLKRCGEASDLSNRHVEVSRAACVPAGLTRIITLGIWQWCPAQVTWAADVRR